MKRLAWLSLALLGACGSGGAQDFTVGNLSLHAVDHLYVSGNYFCDALAQGQIKIVFADYKPACELDRQPGTADPRDPGIAHTELDIILAVGGHPDNRKPYTLSKVDCAVGPGDNGTASFLHFPPNGSAPDTTIQVDSGSVQIETYDPADINPLKGSFDLTFGASQVKGTFDTVACNT